MSGPADAATLDHFRPLGHDGGVYETRDWPGVVVLSWFPWKRSETLEAVELPGGIGSVSLPERFATEMEGNDTLLAYPENRGDITFRFTSISFVPKDQEQEGAAPEHVRERAAEKGYTFRFVADKGVASYDTEAEEEGTPLLIKYWEIGQKNTLLIMSATIVRDQVGSRHVKRMLAIVPRIIDSVDIRKRHRKLVTDTGEEIDATVETVEPVEQVFREFSATETTWLREGLTAAKKLSFRYGSGRDLDPAELDNVFSAWMAAENGKEDAKNIADALGAAFGDHLVREVGFRWGVIEDEYGKEVAVRHSLGETTAYPRASVQKRIDDRQPTFFASVYAVIMDQLERARADGAES